MSKRVFGRRVLFKVRHGVRKVGDPKMEMGGPVRVLVKNGVVLTQNSTGGNPEASSDSAPRIPTVLEEPKRLPGGTEPAKDNSASSAEDMLVEMSTDGSCLQNPGGPGGWAVVFSMRRHGKVYRREMAGFEPNWTTSNRMELSAAIHGLLALKGGCRVKLHTDSRYLEGGFAKIPTRERESWPEKLPNNDLWRRLADAAGRHSVDCSFVKGHSGDPANELCDKLAREAAKNKTSHNDRQKVGCTAEHCNLPAEQCPALRGGGCRWAVAPKTN
jgi:ribonuclease HI